MKLISNLLIVALTGTALAQAPANKPGTPATKPVPAATNMKPAQATPAKPTQAAPAKPTQAAPAQNTAVKPAQPAAGKSAAPAPAKPVTAAAKPQTAPAKPASTAKTPAKKPAKTAVAAKPKHAKKAVAKAAAPAKPAEPEQKKPEANLNPKNRRDPFVSVVVNREGAPCAGGGKKCIDIAQVVLQGVVRAPSGPIAVISSGANKTYFLRENDPVYNGVVVKISPDSIVFRETVIDRVGKTSQREVVKKIRNVPS